MSIRDDLSLRHKLAAEYVLGTLKGGARRRYEAYLRMDAGLRHLTAQWQDRLAPMAQFAPAQQPPASVWNGIEQRLSLRTQFAAAPRWRSNALAFWRTLGVGATAVAAVLATVLVLRAPQPLKTDYLAMLTDDQARPALVLAANLQARTVTVTMTVTAPVAADQTLQLWVLPKDGKPRSLGLLNEHGEVTLPLDLRATGTDIALLAVSLEPKGGSPKADGPSGPILYKGNWVRLTSG